MPSWMCNVKLFVGWFAIYKHFTDVKLGFWSILLRYEEPRRLLMTSALALCLCLSSAYHPSVCMYIHTYLSTCHPSLISLSITYLSPITFSSRCHSRAYGNKAQATLFTRLLKPTGSFSFLAVYSNIPFSYIGFKCSFIW